jgi:transcriptional regulator with XRE-family HTH domain
MVLGRGGRLVGSRGGTMPGPIALKLRDLRVERGLTQKQAAELARVTPQTLIDLESGKRPPYMPTLTKIARGYGVPVEELVEESRPYPPERVEGRVRELLLEGVLRSSRARDTVSPAFSGSLFLAV